MKKVINTLVYILLFFSCFKFASADVFINEIQINPTDERFIELYNSSDSPVSLDGWYIQRRTSTSQTFTSLLSKTYFEGVIIKGGDYLLISRSDTYNADIIFDSLTITDSNTIKIKNSAGEVVDKLGFGIVSDCDSNCAPNPSIGKSIQKTSDGWIIGSKTPDMANIDDSDASGEEDTYVLDNKTSTETLAPDILKINTKIISSKVVLSGISFSLNSITITNRKEIYNVGKYVWNFGDGKDSVVKNAGPFLYRYIYPGEYVVTLSYFDNNILKVPNALDRVIIKVVPSEISIDSVGSYIDSFVEIINNSKNEVLLSGWVINTSLKDFVIPDGTIILPNKKIRFSPHITGFNGNDIKFVNLKNPNYEIVASYPYKNTNNSQSVASDVSNIKKTEIEDANNFEYASEDNMIIDLNQISNDKNIERLKIPNVVYSIIGLLLIIFVGIISFLILKHKKDQDDLDGSINSSDIKIIE